jgi:hypothetical protein
MTRFIPAVCLLVLLAGLAGCGRKKPVSVSGTVTHGGEKLTWPDGGILLVVFVPENAERNLDRYSAETDTATSTYKIAAIPPGRYTVAVQQFDTRFMDKFGKAYDPGRTQLAAEVTHDGQVIDIDLPKGERGGGGFRGKRGRAKGGGEGGGPNPADAPGKDEKKD